MPTLVCTGCTSGLGSLALQLLLQQSPLTWHIIIASRSPTRGQQIVDQLTALAPTRNHRLTCLPLDLTLLGSVKQFATRVQEELAGASSEEEGEGKIDVLLLNAGVYKPTFTPLAGGWSEEAMVNHFAQHYLLHHLQSLLRPPSASHTLPLVIFTTSSLHTRVRSVEKLEAILRGKEGSAMDRYAASKFIQLLGAGQWKDELRGRADVVAVSPGFIPTTSLSRDSPLLQRLFMHYILSWAPFCTSLHDGASSLLRLLLPPPGITDLIERYRESDKGEVLYLGVKGEERELNPLLLAEGGGGEWAVGRERLEEWMNGEGERGVRE
ncbi:hypothetical protein BCR35DRAFT_307097 [Leucosporidium creatinivorum]|uniref:NAD(P)-binding protein n=1 Tax=Leucosporidium creatinivorum TaxID=106004 RepID=A0A1Y2EQ27_9BASI|nr:hypothetical protein BCR35DRAFT_307097 [Leucosporidium creatinivorum]